MPDKVPPKEDKLAAVRQIADAAWASLRGSLAEGETPENLAMLDKAYSIALEAHGTTPRKSGDPYITHPIAVTEILHEFGLDAPALAAALLHDVAEDTDFTISDIRKTFSKEIADLVNGVTKLSKVQLSTQEEQQAENIRKMLIAMSADIRVILIKLADRLHNMRTLQYKSEDSQLRIARETLDIYAPIAHRLGVRWVKEELEDLSLRFMDPHAYEEVRQSMEAISGERREFLAETQQKILECVRPLCPDAEVGGRIKSVHGIYRKMFLQNKSFGEIFDVFAVRILVNTKEECYNALGLIHESFTAIPGRLKDYISMPKPNGYQSLHTVVLVRKSGADGIPFEVQIRTKTMHQMAEYGVAAHWKYKLQYTGKSALDQQLDWLRKLVDSQKEGEEPEDLVQTLKSDFVPEEVYVFTPKGDIINMPQGATVIDFAYAIHSGVGERMIGAKVDGRIVPLETELKTGEIVSIMTSAPPGKGPSRDWLALAKTSSARAKIRAWFKREMREENVQRGREELERELHRNRISFADEDYPEVLQSAAKRHRFENIEDFYAAIGYGGVSVHRMLSYFKEESGKLQQKREEPKDALEITDTKKLTRSKEGVIVEGLDDVLVKFAHCCSPIPGDPIIGFITRGHGVSIHTKGCTNASAERRAEEPGRWLSAYWDTAANERFEVSLLIEYHDRIGILADVSTLCTNMHIPISDFSSRHAKDGLHSFTLSVVVNGAEQFERLHSRIREIKGIVTIARFQA
ncbi:MAG: bifunctional (p)ppGpp synthetase/guanosine-3',5'-bis(diphosphate) 3'-pyrophosphohydrolase [Oscillospiraceae bacterium]|jgi:GTP pyrophosphokinase|nr:bifunctional (p)ppGpp synthetase/guanosine-3',5'-bis(diphosphate) 3'-pyrophosphohydrolase [Oscillospiraceae bacterium]